jgi:hypothetical protein
VKDSAGKEVSLEVTNDAPAKLAVRRQLMEYLYDVPEAKLEKDNLREKLVIELKWKKGEAVPMEGDSLSISHLEPAPEL